MSDVGGVKRKSGIFLYSLLCFVFFFGFRLWGVRWNCPFGKDVFVPHLIRNPSRLLRYPYGSVLECNKCPNQVSKHNILSRHILLPHPLPAHKRHETCQHNLQCSTPRPHHNHHQQLHKQQQQQHQQEEQEQEYQPTPNSKSSPSTGSQRQIQKRGMKKQYQHTTPPLTQTKMQIARVNRIPRKSMRKTRNCRYREPHRNFSISKIHCKLKRISSIISRMYSKHKSHQDSSRQKSF